MELMCQTFSKWKSNRKLVASNDSQWKLGITMEYTGKGMPQRNQLAKLRLADVVGEAGTVSTGKIRKVGNRGTPLIFMGYAKNHARECYCMYNPILGM